MKKIKVKQMCKRSQNVKCSYPIDTMYSVSEENKNFQMCKSKYIKKMSVQVDDLLESLLFSGRPSAAGQENWHCFACCYLEKKKSGSQVASSGKTPRTIIPTTCSPTKGMMPL